MGLKGNDYVIIFEITWGIKSDQNGIERWYLAGLVCHERNVIKSDQNGIESNAIGITDRRVTWDKIRPEWD